MSKSKLDILRTWILNNFLGFVLSIIFAAFSITVSWALHSSRSPYYYPFYFVASILLVSIIPLAQWLALKRFFTGLKWWTLASAGGAIISLLIVFFLPYIYAYNNAVTVVFVTLPIGCMQCLCIHQSLEQKIQWVLASTFGLSSIYIIALYNFNIVFVSLIIYVLLTGGCLTGWDCRSK